MILKVVQFYQGHIKMFRLGNYTVSQLQLKQFKAYFFRIIISKEVVNSHLAVAGTCQLDHFDWLRSRVLIESYYRILRFYKSCNHYIRFSESPHQCYGSHYQKCQLWSEKWLRAINWVPRCKGGSGKTHFKKCEYQASHTLSSYKSHFNFYKMLKLKKPN